MKQNKFDIKQVTECLKINSKAKNKELYQVSHAVTDSQKTMVRQKKSVFLKKKKNITNSGAPGSGTQTLTSADLERRILEALDKQPNNAQILGKAIDFFIKVKGIDKEILKEDIDMEMLKNLGILIKTGD